MVSLKTDTLNNLASAEELADTDLIPVGTESRGILSRSCNACKRSGRRLELPYDDSGNVCND